jgi:hypothetical protein
MKAVNMTDQHTPDNHKDEPPWRMSLKTARPWVKGNKTSKDKAVKRLRQKVISKLWALSSWRVTTPAMDHMAALATIKPTACPWLSPTNMFRHPCGWRACGHAP